MWIKNDLGIIEFKGGKEDWKRAAEIADKCLDFLMDNEDELVADEERSCYNCRYRRWTSSSFTCLRHSVGCLPLFKK
ncbi:MAG: hypothetical protein ACOX6L_02975 [Syntrophomonadaceae bacterium]